jgi:hypothetical protein
MTRRSDPPVVLVKWYDFTKWVLGHVDNFPKNQRFVFGQRLADGVITILELIVDATYSERKSQILLEVNRRLEVLCWLLRLALDRRLLAGKQAPGSKCRKTGSRRSIWHGHFMCCANYTLSGATQDSCVGLLSGRRIVAWSLCW